MDERTSEMASERRAVDVRKTAERKAEEVAGRFGEHKNTAAREALGVARALHSAADQLDRQSQGAAADYTRRAADALQRMSSSLERRSPSQMLSDFERACREHPALVGVGTVMLGFLGARLLRGSTREGTAEEVREAIKTGIAEAEAGAP